jgi:hypothetical protein
MTKKRTAQPQMDNIRQPHFPPPVPYNTGLARPEACLPALHDGSRSTCIAGVAATLISLAAYTGTLGAAAIPIPNGSFESPATQFVTNNLDGWEKSAKPFWFDEGANGPWDQLTGAFLNVPPADPRHIDNCDGNQAVYLFAVPEVALFQDYDSTDWANPTPTHAFDARFEVGKAYQLTVGVIGGGGDMTNGATLEISLYYRDAASNRVTVAATSITNTPAVFSNTTHLVDFQVQVPAVKGGEAWAGKNIGVQLLSTVRPDLAGGYWDLDNVRLTEIREPALLGAARSGGQFQFTLQSEPGLRFEILAGSDLALPLSGWTAVGKVTNVTGTVSFIDTGTGLNRRFYRARQLP